MEALWPKILPPDLKKTVYFFLSPSIIPISGFGLFCLLFVQYPSEPWTTQIQNYYMNIQTTWSFILSMFYVHFFGLLLWPFGFSPKIQNWKKAGKILVKNILEDKFSLVLLQWRLYKKSKKYASAGIELSSFQKAIVRTIPPDINAHELQTTSV